MSSCVRWKQRRSHVVRSRRFQQERFVAENAWVANARLPQELIRKFCHLGGEANALLSAAHKRLRLSARGRAHALRVARTVADLDGSEHIKAAHLAEAIQYRMRELPV